MALPVTPAFVLHRRPFRESSLLVDLLTRDHGRLCVVARGARGGRRGAVALRLHPFIPLQVSWRGRGELPTLSAAEAEGPPLLAHDSRAALVALYLNELVLRLTARDDPHPALFGHYTRALVTLPHGNLEPTLRRFELALLDELGYGLQLRHTADTGMPVEADGTYRFEVESGPIASPPGSDPRLLSGATLLALAEDRLESPIHLREAKSLLSRVVGHYLGNKPLRTRQLLRQLNTESAGTGR